MRLEFLSIRAFRDTAQLTKIYFDDAAKNFLVVENGVADIKGIGKSYSSRPLLVTAVRLFHHQ